jgi:hypothetical protein
MGNIKLVLQAIQPAAACIGSGPLAVPARLCPFRAAALGPEVFRRLVQCCLDPGYLDRPLLALLSKIGKRLIPLRLRRVPCRSFNGHVLSKGTDMAL